MAAVDWKGVRAFGPAVVLALALVWFASFLDEFYPLKQWLFFRYAGYWLLCAFWTAGCVATGRLVVQRLSSRTLPFLESLCTGFAVGVFVFFVLMFLAGILGLFHTALFFALPALMIAVGARPLFDAIQRRVRHARFWRARGGPSSPWSWLPIAFGLVGLGLVYFSILTPDNVQFDSRWKHLALAEQYAHVGGIERFAEGWTVSTNPHLVSILFTWAFLLPWGGIFDRVELAAHMEFVTFLWSVASIPALVRLLVPGSRAAGTWAVRFLFPGIFLYDSSLSAGADHVAALFAIPLFTTLIRSWRQLTPGNLSILGMLMAGGTMPKLTAGMLLVPVPAAAVAIRAGMLLLRGDRKAWRAPVIGALVALAGTAPFWLKNWIWHGDPLYPSLHRYLPLHPWTQDAADLFQWGYKDFQFWRPDRNLEGLLRTLRALVDFSFIPNDYARYHRNVPVFGSLFTLLLFCLPFLRRTARIWAVVAGVQLAIFIWYWTHHQDRYLQTLVPLMAAVTAAIAVKLWHSNLPTRVALSALIVLQVVWGGDVYFIPGHAMLGQAPVKKVADLLAMGHKRRYRERFDVFETWVDAGRSVPEDARVLLHDNHIHLGLSRRTVSDWGGWQFGISYARLEGPKGVYDLYGQLGITHLIWDEKVSKGWDSLAGDLTFFDFALNEARQIGRSKRLVIAEMPKAPPSHQPGPVAILSCGKLYQSGLYPLEALTTPVFGPNRKSFPAPSEKLDADNAVELLRRSDFAVVDPACESLPSAVRSEFVEAAERKIVNSGLRKPKPWKLYVRDRRAATASPVTKSRILPRQIFEGAGR